MCPVDATARLIASFRVPGGGIVELAQPAEPDRLGAVNVLCGLNNSGKSYVLTSLRAALTPGGIRTGKLNAVEFGLTMTHTEDPSHRAPRVLYLGRTYQEKQGAGVVNLAVSELRMKLPGNVPDFRRLYLRFLRRQIVPHCERLQQVSEDSWLRDIDLRRSIIDELRDEKWTYRCSAVDPLVATIQQELGASLRFRRCKPAGGRAKEERDPREDQVEFVLAYEDGSTIAFPRWSDGQRAVFYILTLLHEFQPDILLMDEIENHLHPAYMTRILERIKVGVPQSLIATHHPHVIFSDVADRVLFLETDLPGPSRDPQPMLPHQKGEFGRAPTRRVLTLETSFAKVSATYKLFDSQDRQLLRQAALVERNADIVFYGALQHAFEPDVAEPEARPLRDKQTMALAEQLRIWVENLGSGPFTVLDFGAGVGRIARELHKVHDWKVRSDTWLCWERDDASRTRLAKGLTESGVPAIVLRDLGEVADECVDVLLLANVLHHMTPEDVAGCLATADRILKPEHGGVVVLELFPLCRAERFAVAYPDSVLREAFEACGYSTARTTVGIKHDTGAAYCLLARKAPGVSPLATTQLQKSFEDAWETLERQCVSAYVTRQGLAGLADYRNLMSELLSLTSIAAWRQYRQWPV